MNNLCRHKILSHKILKQNSKMNHFKSRYFNYIYSECQKKMYIMKKYIHTYTIGHYNPSVRIIVLVSHATYDVCVNFIDNWRDLQFKEKLFMAILVYSKNFCQKSAEKKLPKKDFLYLVLMSGFGLEPWLFRLIRQHINNQTMTA